MANLPTKLPQWYTVDDSKEKGWTPETTDIINNKENQEVIAAWNGTIKPQTNNNYTVQINNLKVISPIQVGGGSLPEGMSFPAQIGGVPVIPGSSLKGAFLNYLLNQWANFSSDELDFFSTLIEPQKRCWYPKIIRVENILLKNLKPYPLNAQQDWQIFDRKDNKLSIQWQVTPKHPPSPSCDQFSLQITLKTSPTKQQKNFLETRLLEMLEKQGIGRGRSSGFGRLATKIPSGQWKIELKGMKPGIQTHNLKENQRGDYRWTPQVLRANIRNYFTRLTLSILEESNAKKLTNQIFGGLNSPPSPLTLTSYLDKIVQPRMSDLSGDYSNCNAKDVHSTWIINVDCSERFKPLIGDLFTLASLLGGLGPGWRRPPHSMSKNVFRGSEFTLTLNDDVSSNGIVPHQSVSNSNIQSNLSDLISRLLSQIKELAITSKIVANFNHFKPSKRKGSILSIWQGKSEQWMDIVHGICSSRTPQEERPDWCGDTKSRPSGYAIRQYDNHCLVTVFDQNIEPKLRKLEFNKLYEASS